MRLLKYCKIIGIIFLFLFEITQADEQGFGRRGFGIGIGHRYNRYRGFARGGAGVHVGQSSWKSDELYYRKYYKHSWPSTWPNDPERKYDRYRLEGETSRIDRMKVGSSSPPGGSGSNRSGRSSN